MREIDECHAPVFNANSGCACLFLTIIYALTIMLLIIGTLGLILLSARGRCLIKQYQYRIRNCTKGNQNSNLLI